MESLDPRKWTTVGQLGAAGLLCVTGLFLWARRPVSREFLVRAYFPRTPEQVFALHVEPESFYGVLKLRRDGDAGYTVVRRRSLPNSLDAPELRALLTAVAVDAPHLQPSLAAFAYDLEHRVRAPLVGTEAVIRSAPVRFNVDRRGGGKGGPLRFGFEEAFAALGTTLLFRWTFSSARSGLEGNAEDSGAAAGAGTDVALRIRVVGPWISVAFLSRVEQDFQRRFSITAEHLDTLIPPR